MSEVRKKRKTLKVATYRWLRWPAMLLGSVGLWGVLNARLEIIAKASGMFNLPAAGYCYVIMTGAAVLFAISVFYKQPRKEQYVLNHADSQQCYGWRNR